MLAEVFTPPRSGVCPSFHPTLRISRQVRARQAVRDSVVGQGAVGAEADEAAFLVVEETGAARARRRGQGADSGVRN